MAHGRLLLLLLVINGFIKSQGQAPRQGLPLGLPFSMGIMDMDVNPMFAAAALAGVPAGRERATSTVNSIRSTDISKTAAPSSMDLVANEQNILRRGVIGGVSVDMSGFVPPQYIPLGVTAPSTSNNIAPSSFVSGRVPRSGSLPIVAIDERELGLSKDGKFLTMREQYTPLGSLGHSNTIEVPRHVAFRDPKTGGTVIQQTAVTVGDIPQFGGEQNRAVSVNTPSHPIVVDPAGIPLDQVADAQTGESLPDVHPTFVFPQQSGSVAIKPTTMDKPTSFVPEFNYQATTNELSKPNTGSSRHDRVPRPIFDSTVNVRQSGGISVNEPVFMDTMRKVGDGGINTAILDSVPPTRIGTMNRPRSIGDRFDNSKTSVSKSGINIAPPPVFGGVPSRMPVVNNPGTIGPIPLGVSVSVPEGRPTGIYSAVTSTVNTNTAAHSSINADGSASVGVSRGGLFINTKSQPGVNFDATLTDYIGVETNIGKQSIINIDTANAVQPKYIQSDTSGGISVGALAVDQHSGMTFGSTGTGSVVAATSMDKQRLIGIDTTNAAQPFGIPSGTLGGISSVGLAVDSGVDFGLTGAEPISNPTDGAIESSVGKTVDVAGHVVVGKQDNVAIGIDIAPSTDSVGGVALNVRSTDMSGSVTQETSNTQFGMSSGLDNQIPGGMVAGMTDVSGIATSGRTSGDPVVPGGIRINMSGMETDTNAMVINSVVGMPDTVGSMNNDQSRGSSEQTLVVPSVILKSAAGPAIESTGGLAINPAGGSFGGMIDVVSTGTHINNYNNIDSVPVAGQINMIPDTTDRMAGELTILPDINSSDGTAGELAMGTSVYGTIPTSFDQSIIDTGSRTIDTSRYFAVDTSIAIPFAKPGGAPMVRDATIGIEGRGVFVAPIDTTLSGASGSNDSFVTPTYSSVAIPVIDTSAGASMEGDIAVRNEIFGTTDSSTVTADGFRNGGLPISRNAITVDSHAGLPVVDRHSGGFAIGTFGNTGFDMGLSRSEDISGVQGPTMTDVTDTATVLAAGNTGSASVDVASNTYAGVPIDNTVEIARDETSIGISTADVAFIGGIALPGIVDNTFDTSAGVTQDISGGGFAITSTQQSMNVGTAVDPLSSLPVDVSRINAIDTNMVLSQISGRTGFDMLNSVHNTPSGLPIGTMATTDINTVGTATGVAVGSLGNASVKIPTSIPIVATVKVTSDIPIYVDVSRKAAVTSVDRTVVGSSIVADAITRNDQTAVSAESHVAASDIPTVSVSDVVAADNTVDAANTGTSGTVDQTGGSPDSIAVIAGTAIDTHTGQTDGGAELAVNTKVNADTAIGDVIVADKSILDTNRELSNVGSPFGINSSNVVTETATGDVIMSDQSIVNTNTGISDVFSPFAINTNAIPYSSTSETSILDQSTANSNAGIPIPGADTHNGQTDGGAELAVNTKVNADTAIGDVIVADQSILDTNRELSNVGPPFGINSNVVTETATGDVIMSDQSIVNTNTGISDVFSPFAINTNAIPYSSTSETSILDQSIVNSNAGIPIPGADTSAGDTIVTDQSIVNANTEISGVETPLIDTAGATTGDIVVIAGTAIDTHTGQTDGGPIFDMNINTNSAVGLSSFSTDMVNPSVVMTIPYTTMGGTTGTGDTTGNIAAIGSSATDAMSTINTSTSSERHLDAARRQNDNTAMVASTGRSDGTASTDINSSRPTETSMHDISQNVAYTLPGKNIFNGVAVDNFGGMGYLPTIGGSGVSLSGFGQDPQYDVNSPVAGMTRTFLPTANNINTAISPTVRDKTVDWSGNISPRFVDATIPNNVPLNKETDSKIYTAGNIARMDSQSVDQLNIQPPNSGKVYEVGKKIVIDTSSGMPGMHTFATSNDFTANVSPTYSPAYVSYKPNQPVVNANSFSTDMLGRQLEVLEPRLVGNSHSAGVSTNTGFNSQKQPIISRQPSVDFISSFFNQPIGKLSPVSMGLFGHASRDPFQSNTGIYAEGKRATTIAAGGTIYTVPQSVGNTNQQRDTNPGIIGGVSDAQTNVAAGLTIPNSGNNMNLQTGAIGKTADAFVTISEPAMANQGEWVNFLAQTDVPEVNTANMIASETTAKHVKIAEIYQPEMQNVLSTSEIRTAGTMPAPSSINVNLGNKETGTGQGRAAGSGQDLTISGGVQGLESSAKMIGGLTDLEIYRFAQMLRQWSNSQLAGNVATSGTTATQDKPSNSPDVPPFVAPGMAGGSAVTVQLRRNIPAGQPGTIRAMGTNTQISSGTSTGLSTGAGMQRIVAAVQRPGNSMQGTTSFARGTGAIIPSSAGGLQDRLVNLPGADRAPSRTGTSGAGGITVTGVRGISVRFHDASEVQTPVGGLRPIVGTTMPAASTSTSGSGITKSFFTQGTPMERFGLVPVGSTTRTGTGPVSSGSFGVGSATVETAPPAIIPDISQGGVLATTLAARLGQKLGTQFRAGLLPITTASTGAIQKQLTLPKPYVRQTCTMEADPISKYHFYIKLGKKKFHLKCAYGTAFDSATCECSTIVLQHGEDCLEVNLDFTNSNNNNEVIDTTINQLPIDNKNVDITNSSALFPRIAVFGGDGKLTVWRYQNYDFRNHVMLKLRFRPGIGGDRFQPLIANCDGGPEGPSVAIIFDREMNEITMMLQTVNNTDLSLTFKINPNTWSDVTYIYDETYFAGVVNGIQQVLPSEGLVQIRDAALIMGYCPRFGGFNGGMDDISIYMCVPPHMKLRV